MTAVFPGTLRGKPSQPGSHGRYHRKTFMHGTRNCTTQRDVRQDEARSDIAATRIYGGLFITAFQQLTCDRTCSRLSVPALIHPVLAPALIELTPPCFIFIRDTTDCRALSPRSRPPSSLTRKTHNKQAIFYISCRAIVAIFSDFSYFSRFSRFPLLIIRAAALFCFLFNSRSCGF